ncbi:UNVERIFIED_CONTAM: hypothetical protein FKN15_011680 [Acipenser sinensis]
MATLRKESGFTLEFKTLNPLQSYVGPDHQAVLQEARKYFTAKRCQAFSHSIAFTHSHGLQAFLLFSAALKISHNSTVHLF